MLSPLQMEHLLLTGHGFTRAFWWVLVIIQEGIQLRKELEAFAVSFWSLFAPTSNLVFSIVTPLSRQRSM